MAVEEVPGQDLAIRGHHENVGAESEDLLDRRPRPDALRLEKGDAELPRRVGNRPWRGAAPAPRARRLGDGGHHRMARIAGAEAGDSELGGAGKYDAHGRRAYPVRGMSPMRGREAQRGSVRPVRR
jgi:hypothetical protein